MGWIRTTTTASVSISEKPASNEKLDIATEHIEIATPVEEKPTAYPILPKRTAEKDLPLIPAEEVKKQDGKDGRRLFIVIDSTVLDCTSYIHRHPAGKGIIQGFGGQDCSWQWWTFHDQKIWNDVAMYLRVGKVLAGIENRHQKPKAFVGLRGFGYQDDDW